MVSCVDEMGDLPDVSIKNVLDVSKLRTKGEISKSFVVNVYCHFLDELFSL